MQVLTDNILDFIPQRNPMVMVDSLISCSENHIVTQLTLREENIFLDNKGFNSSGLMENMAQTAAARTGYLLKKYPGSANKIVPVGVIGSIKNFKAYLLPPKGSKIITSVHVVYEVMNATRVKGKVEVDGQLAAEAELQVFITETNRNKP